MKNYKSIVLLILNGCSLVIGCKKQPTTTEATDQSTPQVEVKIDTFYTGGGNEPGWRVLLLKDQSGKMTYDLLLDYGEKHETGITNKLPNPGENMAIHYVLNNETKPLILSITNDACIDDGDIKYETSVSLSDKNFILKGCGRFLD